MSAVLTAATLFAAAIGAQAPVLLGNARSAAPGGAAPQAAAGLSPQALAQIDALLQEKSSWSPAQRKIDSRLLIAAKTARGEPMVAGVPAMAGSVETGPDGRIVIDVRATVTDALLAQLRALGAEVVSAAPAYHDIQLRVTMAQVEPVAALPDVIFIQPKQEALTQRETIARAVKRALRGTVPRIAAPMESRVGRLMAPRVGGLMEPRAFSPGGDGQGATTVVTNAGSKISEGDAAHRAAEARSALGIDGTGVKIGVLSDGVVGLSTSALSGDLPPLCAGAPAPNCVTVLAGQAGPTTTGSAEGTAMLEIIHDLAPGAQLYFATALNGLASFAQNIRDLRAAGCDIIVDDVGYFVETPFQDGQDPAIISTTNAGVVIQAVKDVVASGAMYFSSAANSGNLDAGTSGTWEGDFADGGAAGAPIVEGGRLHSFGALTYDTLTLSGGNANNLYWSDPLGASANDYDLFRLDSTGTIVLAASLNVQNGTQDPYEQVSAGSAGDRLVIVKYAGAPRFLHLSTLRGRLSIATAGETHGHAATSAANSFGVAATPARSPGPNPDAFNGSNVVEAFSSDGPRRIFFTSAGTAITSGNVSSTGGQVLSKPDITAADRVTVTGSGGFSTLFSGTSAAAPHAAALAALIKSHDLGQTPDEVRAALLASVIDIGAAGPDRDSGAGIVMATTAAPVGATPPAITVEPQGRAIAPEATAALNVVVTGTPAFTYQWYEGPSGTTTTPVGANAASFTTPALLATTSYWVRVSNGFGSADSATATVAVGATVGPAIAVQPRSFGVLSGQAASLGVTATGAPLAYQWYLGTSGDTSTPIGGATSGGYLTPALTVATNYWVRVSNTSGSVDSTTATINVGTGPSIGVQPSGIPVSCGQTALLSVSASGTAPLSFQWFSGASGDRSAPILGAASSSYTTSALFGTSSFWVRVWNPFEAASSTTATVTVNAGPNCAQYDATLKAPTCAVAGNVCDAGNLLMGRDSLSDGAEPHQPNTILDSCADGTAGIFHSDESNDGLRISTMDGGPFAPGRTVRIDATVWAYSATSDFLDLYYTADAANPAWTRITTLTPPGTGAQTLSATYVLPAGSVQAVRAVFRYQGSAAPCGANSGYDDHDDLIFAAPSNGAAFVQNGDFAAGTTHWSLFEIPDMVAGVVNGVFQFHKANPTTTASGQAVVFQNTGQPVAAGAPVQAIFSLGNTDTTRKRISVLVLDADFSDLSVCTFWLAPGAPSRTYQMQTHPTKDWADASIYFYAASIGTGDYLLDNVSFGTDPGGAATETNCLDPTAPPPSAAAAGPNLLVNGDFSTGAIAPWGLFGDLTSQVGGGVFEFIRPGTPGQPAGVILQSTNAALPANQILAASFQLGNSSGVRKRVTVLLHDSDFTDLTACTFWLPAGQPLSTYTMRSFTTKAWANATLSVYAASTGLDQWTQLDNVTLQRTPGSTALGTECLEPAVIGTDAGRDLSDGARGLQTPGRLDAQSPARQSPEWSRGLKTPGSMSHAGLVGNAGPAFVQMGEEWRAEAWTSGRAIVAWAEPLDLMNSASAHLTFASWLASRGSTGEVQVSLDGVAWQAVATVPATDGWTDLEVDLSAFAGRQIFVRFAFDGVGPGLGSTPDTWLIARVALRTDP